MDDNNKLPKQAKPQEFELVELLFQEYIRSNIASLNIEYSFQARFQSFINQIPSYLHSSSKIGFFTHFFFGSFATLLDTKLGEKLGVKKLQYSFNTIDNLRIAAETNAKTHIFIFTEYSSKNNKKQKQDKNKELAFTKLEWQQLKGRKYTDADNDTLEISVIKINKSKGSIKVIVEKQDIKDSSNNIKQYHDFTKQCVDENSHHIYLEDEISKFAHSKTRALQDSLKFILDYIKQIHDYYQNIPYGDSAKEAEQHGFVAGIFNNFRYRENAHVYLEQFAGRGYADIVLLVRGADRATKSIPIIIELKAGTSIGTTSAEALKQVLDYTQGFQPNNMRILSLADNILCVGMNLDHNVNSFIQMQLVQRQSKVIPVIQSIITRIIENDFTNQNLKKDDLIAIQNQIKVLLENTYQTFPGVGEKSSAHYYSRFIIGQSFLLQDYDKHIFVYDKDEYIATKTVIDQHATRLNDGSTTKKKKIEKIVDDSNAVTSILLLSKDQDEPAIMLNIIDANREIELKNIPLDGALIGNRKVVKLNIKFNINKSNKSFKEYCDIELSQFYNSALEYNNANNIQAKGNLKKISFKTSIELSAQIKNAIDSQQGLIISESKYKELFTKIGEVIYPVKSLINSESEFQGILEGIFKYYSDLKLSQQLDRRELVLTEFQTGGGSRIDMLVQAIGSSEQGMKEYIPVGLELKYDDSVKLNSFDKKQDEYIQGLILAHKEQVLVKELLADQIERYAQGAAIKTITDGNKVAIMGIVFNKQAQDHNSLLLTTKKLVEANIVHSSKLYTTSVNIDVPSINDLPKPDSDGFIPDWVERDTLNLIAKAETDDDSSMWYLSNSLLDNQKIQELQNLLQKDKQLAQYIDGLDLSFNSVTASSVKELIKQLRRLVYLDLSDNDLANNNLLDLKEIIEDIQVPILKIADIGMNDEQMGKIFKSLAENDKISDLDITHLEDDNNLIMSQDTASKIAQYLKSTRMLNYLNIAHNKIDDVAMSIIAQGLKGQSTLRSLVLTENSIGTQGTKALGEVLKDTTISNIDLSGNPLGILGVQAIVAGLKDADNIESIVLVNVALKYNRYDRDTSRKLLSSISSLFQNQHLTKINIAENNIGNGALSKIFRILSTRGEKSNLQDLSLAGNTIDWGAHQATINTLKSYMYDFISTSKKIRSLDLAFMSIDDDLGQAIAQALEKNVSLINLDFGGNYLIGNKTVQGLANVLKTHQYLKYLNLSDNKLSITDIRLILEAMRMNQVVSHINLSGNDFSGIIIDADGKQIMDLDHQDIDFMNLLKGNKELKYLNLAKCQLSQKSLLSLFKAIENNMSLEVLDIRDNKIESSIIDNILRSLEKNANQGLEIGLKVLHISKGVLDRSVISKLMDKSLGISVLVDDDVLPSDSLDERLEQVCQIDPVDKKEPLEVDRESQTFERETVKGHYHYWLQANDILDIARVHYGYDNRAIEIVGSISQLSREITQYLSNGNNSGAFTMILNIGESGAGGNHWVSLVLNRVGSSNYGYYIDSVGNSIAGNVVNILNQHGILIHDFNTRQQIDGYNCGLWALENSRRICEIVEENRAVSKEDIRNSLVRSRSEEEFEEMRDNILRELLNDNQRRVNLENMGLAQVEMPQDYNDNYELYRQSMASYEQCAMLAMRGSSFKVAKSKRSISKIEKKLSLDSQKFVDCAHAVKQDMLYSQLMLLVNHFQVVGDNKSCKAIDQLIKNQGIINRLKSIDKTIPIEIINVKDSGYNWNLLHKAAQFGDAAEVERLIIQGIDVNIKAIDCWTPLHLASQYASKEVVRVLISKGADLHVRSKDGWWSALHLGSQSGDKEVTRILIDEFKANNKSVSIKSKGGWTPLHLAVQLGDKGIIELLLREGADVNAPAKGGWRPLHLASRYNNTEVVCLLLEKVSDVNSQVKGHNKWTALHFAAQLGNKEMIRLLKNNGANGDILDKDGNTAKMIAMESGTLKLVDKEITDSGMNLLVQLTTKISKALKLHVEQSHNNNNYHETAQWASSNLSKVSNFLNDDKTTSTITANQRIKCSSSSVGCQDRTELRKKRMLEKKQSIENSEDHYEKNDLKAAGVIRAELEDNQHHKHSHHHGKNTNGAEHHRDHKTILGDNNRVRGDIGEELQRAKDTNNNDDIAVAVGDFAVISSSSGSSVKPIGYNMINWLRDNIWQSINLNPIERIKNLLNVDDVKEQVKIRDIDVSDNIGYVNNKNQQDDLVKKLSIIRTMEAQIVELEEKKIEETKLLKAMQQKLNTIGRDYQYKYDKQQEYEEELSNSLLTLQIRKVEIQKQDAKISQIVIIKEINNEIEKIKQAIQANEQLNSDYFHAIATVKEMVLHGEITELFYEDCIRYLGPKIKYCEEEDIRLINALQELEQQQEEYYTYNTLESIVEEKNLPKIEALNTQQKKILQEDEELKSIFSSNQDQKQAVYRINDQIKLQKSKIESLSKRLDELHDILAILYTSDSNLAGHKELSYWDETIDAKNDTAYQVSRGVNNSLNLTNLSNGFIGNNTYQDQIFDYNSLDFQGNLLLLNLLMHKKNGVKYNHGNKSIITNDLNTEYAQNLAYNAYAPYRAENEEDMELIGAS